MPQSLVKMLIHIVFSTKNRADLILPEIERDLFGYLNGIVGNNGSKLILANGTTNHVHLLVSLGKTITISELVGDIKRDSSKWIKKKIRNSKIFIGRKVTAHFRSGKREVGEVMKYIAAQKEHHKQKDFKDEMRGFYRKYEIEYDERYVWD